MKVFIVHSIYHIFYSLSIARNDNISEATILCSNSNPSNFFRIFNIIESNFNFKIITINHNDLATKISSNDLESLNFIKKQNIEELVIFNQDNLIAVYLAKFFYKKNCKVSLAQDGLKAYAHINRVALKYKIERSLMYYKFTKLNGLEYSFFFANLHYGNFPFINNLYLSHPEACLGSKKTKTEVNLVDEVLDMFSELLESHNIDFGLNTLFFTSSILKFNNEEIGIELKILNELENIYPTYQKILKVHPRVSDEVFISLRSLKTWKIIKDIFPAELLISNLKANIVLYSGYSSVALYNPLKFGAIKIFWLYPLYGSSKKALTWLQINKPSENIQLISSLAQLKELKDTLS